MSQERPQAPVSLAYLVSQYPALSMIFIIREVVQLRARGFNIDVASINPADRTGDALTRVEADEAAMTYYVKPDGIRGALRANMETLRRQPGGYLRGLALIFRLGQFDLRALFYNLMYFIEALMVGCWMQRKGQIHLHAHLGAQSATVAMFVKRIFGFGYSITVHGPDEFYNAPGQYLTQKVEHADFICCISNFARSQLMKLSAYEHWHKLEVARLGIDPNVFTPRPFEVNPEVFEIICVGRLVPAKGQHILVDAIGCLAEEERKVHLRLVGDGPDRDSLLRHVQQRGLADLITFEGAVNQDRIRTLYARAHIFSMPSFAEGIPVVLMEAMSMEIPCVTTHITGIPELIRNGVDGLLVAPSAVEELATALAQLMDNPEMRRQIGESGRKRVIEHYNLEKNVELLGDIFQRRLGAAETST